MIHVEFKARLNKRGNRVVCTRCGHELARRDRATRWLYFDEPWWYDWRERVWGQGNRIRRPQQRRMRVGVSDYRVGDEPPPMSEPKMPEIEPQLVRELPALVRCPECHLLQELDEAELQTP